MRIGLVSEYFDLTGSTPTVLYNLVHFLRNRHADLDFEVITSRNVYRGTQVLPKREHFDRIDITRLATPKSNRPSTLLRLAAGMGFTSAAFFRLVARPRLDLVIVVTNPPSLPMAARALRRLRGTPFLYLVHDLYPDVANVLGVLPRDGLASRTLHAAQQRWLHSANRTVVLGRCMRDYLVRTYQVDRSKVDVIPNWGDPGEISHSPPSRFRQEHGIEGIMVLYSGNFGMHQDFDVILDAAKLMRERNPDVVFVLVGDGAKKEHIMRRIEAEKLSNVRVYPLVASEDYSDLLASMDVGLVTLVRGAEGIGVPSKFYSILAAGKPTVAVVEAHSEVALVLNESESGYQVDPGNSQGLAAAIEKLASAPDERARLGSNARATLLGNYTLDRIGERFYDSMISAAGAGPRFT